jgi:gamma-glutamyltranspeptidase/glutathione hydrolase
VLGTVAGLFATLPHAKLSMHDLIQPAIDLAEYGFVLTQREASSLNSNKAGFEKYNTSLPVFVKATLWKAGDTLIQKDLAATLKRIQADGAKGFYEGKTAELIVAEMEKGKGIITTADLKNYTAKQRELLSFNYKNYEITGFPPPSSGGILLLQMMKMVANYPLVKMGFQTSATVQLMVEAEEGLMLIEQNIWAIQIFESAVKTLTSDTYIANRMKDFVAGKATESVAVKGGSAKESEETTHLSVYDALGNMVSVTTTLNGGYGSRTVVAGAGFLLNNEMDDFSIQPGVANMYGALGGEANAIVPSKRMLSSMCPVVVTKDGKPFLVVGTPGGTTIPTSVYQTLLNMIEFNMNVSDAVNKPKFHHQHLPDEVYVEKLFQKM